jgi:NAD(P)H dehydrogenase (quinone)
MNTLIIHAHHEPQSFCSAMANTAATTLRQQGHIITISDLYAMSWNPVASAADFISRDNPDYLTYALEQRKGWASQTLAPDILAEVEKLMVADLVILNFPLYWFSVPAILKGWFDRVLLSGVTYGGRRIYDRGPLKGKKALLACTLGGRQHMFDHDGIHGETGILLKHILQGTLGYVGMDVLTPFFGYHVPYLNDDDRAAILDAYQKRLNNIWDEPPLKMPNLNDYDDVLKKI